MLKSADISSQNSIRLAAGFTLIELLLTLAIMSVLSIFGIMTYREYNQSKIIESSAQDIQDMLVLARSRASTQVKPEVLACSEGRPLYGYKVDFCQDSCISSHNYRLSVVCGAEGEYAGQIGETKALPSGITFGSQEPVSVLFRVLSGEVVGVADVSISGFGAVRTVSVSPSGVVSVVQ